MEFLICVNSPAFGNKTARKWWRYECICADQQYINLYFCLQCWAVWGQQQEASFSDKLGFKYGKMWNGVREIKLW